MEVYNFNTKPGRPDQDSDWVKYETMTQEFNFLEIMETLDGTYTFPSGAIIKTDGDIQAAGTKDLGDTTYTSLKISNAHYVMSLQKKSARLYVSNYLTKSTWDVICLYKEQHMPKEDHADGTVC